MTNGNKGNTSYDGAYTEMDSRYSRDASRYVQEAQPQRRREGVLRKLGLVLLVAALVAGFGALGYMLRVNGNLRWGLDSSVSSVLVKADMNRPFYMVLFGTDESIDRNENWSTDGIYRTDTIVLARVDAPNKQATLVSMQRDTQVDLGQYGIQKLNAAYTFGGPALAISTVSDIADVGIAHFALIDMNGLQDVVNALGGIEVDVPMEIWDEDAGGHLDAGYQTLDGWQALILCRSRNAYEDFGNGDMYRAANQRLVIQAIADKILSSDVATIAHTVEALSKAVQTDMSVGDIIALAQAFQGMDTQANLWTANMPTESFYEDDLWYERIVEPDWGMMMQRVNAGLPPTEDSMVDVLTGTVLSNAGGAGVGLGGVAPSAEATRSGTIAVRNGSGVDGIASTVAQRLAYNGYEVADVGNADSYDYDQTLIVFDDPSQEDEAYEIAWTLGEGHVLLNDGEYLVNEDFLVVIGRDFATFAD